MTINVQYSWTEYVTDGVQTLFAYPFFLKDPGDLLVYWEAVLLPPGAYTLTGIGLESGGNVVFVTPLPPGRLVLKRGTPQNQLTDYIEGDAFPAESHEDGLDRLTVLVQDLAETLSRASLLRVTTSTPWRNLVLPDPVAGTVLGWDSQGQQWTLYPSGVLAIPVDPVSGIGWGKNTVEVRPAAGAGQASGLVFPAGVLALALTVWVETTLGMSQGLQQVGIGTVDRPDCWGVLPALSALVETSAGLFQGYGGQPMPQSGTVTLTAYGGRFDGTGVVYVTGYFATFAPGRQPGYVYSPSTPDAGQILPPLPAASETVAGIAEVATSTETTTGTDDSRLVTPLKLAQRLQAYGNNLPQATETLRGAVELATTAEVTTGTDTLRAVTPATLAAKVPAGTALSVTRYAASGTALEATPGLTTTSDGRLGIGAAPASTDMLRVAAVGSGSVSTLTRSVDTNGAPVLQLRKSRGTDALPTPVLLSDQLGSLHWSGYSRDSGNTQYGDQVLVVVRAYADAVDAQERASGRLAFFTAEASGVATEKLRLTAAGNLLLGTLTHDAALRSGLVVGSGVAPASSPADAVQAWVADRNALAGKASLHVRTEDGVSHVLGDVVGIGTLCTATLGGGAVYRPLSVNGNLLLLGPSSVQERPQALFANSFPVATDASRTARLAISTYDSVAAREGLRLEADGTAARIGFLGAAAVVRQTVPAAATDATTTQTLANSLRTALLTLGLCV